MFKSTAVISLAIVLVKAVAVLVDIAYPFALYDVNLNCVDGVPAVLANMIELTNRRYCAVAEPGIFPVNVTVNVLPDTLH